MENILLSAKIKKMENGILLMILYAKKLQIKMKFIKEAHIYYYMSK